VVVFILQWVLGPPLTSSLVYYAPATFAQPWRMLTSLFAHGSPMHLLFNMFSLFVIGRMLEPELGRLRFGALFFISGLGGLIAVLLLQPQTLVLGASGAIFGLLGALFVLVRRFGGNTTQLIIVVSINLAIGFFVANISWQGHVGGLIVGALLAAILVRTRNQRQRVLQAAAFIAVGVVLLLIAAVWTLT
jgi:membrane associated rhomboid family serine protease